MAEQGYTRTIVSDKNVEYELPTAEYCLLGNYIIAEAYEKAVAAAALSAKKHSILVSEAVRTKFRLDPVEG